MPIFRALGRDIFCVHARDRKRAQPLPFILFGMTPVLARSVLCLVLVGVQRLAVAEPATLLGDYRTWGVARFAQAANPPLEAEPDGVDVFGGEEALMPPVSGIDMASAMGTVPPRLTVTSLGIAWRHMLDAHEQLRFSAQYDDVSDARIAARAASNYFATVGWRGAYSSAGRAQIGGSVYIGEESADHSSAYALGRRYFGVRADGSYALFKDHGPFLSLRLQRSDYDDAVADGGSTDARQVLRGSEELSQFSAGWDWQVYPSWHVRAQAEYALNKSDLSLYDYDANRLFFSTRFDFR